MQTSAHFYRDIVPVGTFREVVSANRYQQAPNDWLVVISDIENSTAAIAEGRYKAVNMVGAACINAVLNVSAKGEVPYVFGGDGATLMVPPERLSDATDALLGVRHLASTQFDLSLRVGVVPVGDIQRAGDARVLVTKYSLSEGNVLAAFSGGGMECAEQWIKRDSRYHIESDADRDPPDLSGLSCRWEPLQARRGVMLSVLVNAAPAEAELRAGIYRDVMDAVSRITGSIETDAKPIGAENLVLRWPPRELRSEIAATARHRNVFWWGLALYANSLLQWVLDRFDLTLGGYRGARYRVELRDNTDYQRFDDTLRVLLDCTGEQADRIEADLSERFERGELKFGLHRSDAALMTCLVFNLGEKQHIHFVDGSDGGFTSAAKQMKQLSGGSK
ncbi:MAG: DUF3095 domain-containing protein [Pseudomonadota bacterium]